MTAAAYLAGLTAVSPARRRSLCLTAGAWFDDRVNRRGENGAACLASIQTNAQLVAALTAAGQLANFQSLTAG